MSSSPLATPLARFSTLGVGGPAQRFVRAPSEDALLATLAQAVQAGAAVFILGGGSNVVFHDEGFDGWVIQPSSTRLSFHEEGEDVFVRADAGVVWDTLVQQTVARGLAGIEAMSGIPGHVGAAPIQNIGAYGQELSHTLTQVRAYDRRAGDVITLRNEDCDFAYRDSRFKRAGADAYVILEVELRLRRPKGPLPLRYGDLRQHFGGETAPNVAQLRDAVLSIRAQKGMVYSPGDVDSHSVGSFFMNPVLDAAAAEQLKAKAQAAGLDGLPCYEQPDGRYKLSAAWLIERAGVSRGFRLGSAGISSKHVLALMNPGHATAADLRRLARHVQAAVWSQWGVWLTPEVRIMQRAGLDASFYTSSPLPSVVD